MKYLLILLALLLTGCTTDILSLPNGIEIRHTRGVTDAKATRIEIYYEDPNTVVWIIVNDPNSSVHPGRLKIKEPYSGVEVGIEAD